MVAQLGNQSRYKFCGDLLFRFIEIEREISNSKIRIRGAVCFHQLDNDRTVSSQYEQQTPSRLRKRGPQDLATARYKALVRQMDTHRRKDSQRMPWSQVTKPGVFFNSSKSIPLINHCPVLAGVFCMLNDGWKMGQLLRAIAQSCHVCRHLDEPQALLMCL